MPETGSNASTIDNYLEKMNSKDKDFRFMAVSDLMNEFTKNNIKLDEDSERKCETVVDALCENMLAKADELREVSSTALSSFIKSIPPGSNSTKISLRLLPKLLNVLTTLKEEDASAKNEVIDIIGEVLARNGATLTNHHSDTEKVLLSHIVAGRPAVRKRAIGALAHLAVAASRDLFYHIVNEIISDLVKPKAEANTLTAALIALARSRPQHFATFIPSVVPIFLGFAGDSVERRAIALMLKKAIVYDPNYSYDVDEGKEKNGREYYDEGDFSDYDDLSWKVRRAALKAIEAIFEANRDDELHLASAFCPILISRLKEREDNVRTEIFDVYWAILKRLATSRIASVVEVARAQMPSLLKAITRTMKSKNMMARQQSFDLLSKANRALPHSLAPFVPQLMEGAAATLDDGYVSSQLKITVLAFLDDVLPNYEPSLFFPSIDRLIPFVSNCIQDMIHMVSLQALVVAAPLLKIVHKKEGEFSEVEPLYDAIYDKLSFDSSHMAFLARQSAIFPPDDQFITAAMNKLELVDREQALELLPVLFDALSRVDREPKEIREHLIFAGGVMLQHFDLDDNRANEMLHTLMNCVCDEPTRLISLQSLSMVVDSSRSSTLLPVLPELLQKLSYQLKKKNTRAVKTAAISLIFTIFRTLPASLEDGLAADALLPILPSLITEAEISQYALRILSVYTSSCPCPLALSYWMTSVISAISNLCKSSILQGATSIALLEFIENYVRSPVLRKPNIESLLDQLSAPVYSDAQSALSRQSVHAYAAVIAVAASESDQSNAAELSSKLAVQLTHSEATDTNRIFALLTMGELGRRAPQIYQTAKFKPEDIILSAFASPNEDIKGAGAVALGALVVGSLPTYLPFLLNQITTQPKRQYQLLHALKEVIVHEMSLLPGTDAAFVAQMDAVWAVLEKHADCAEEGTRTVVAECLCKLCHINPAVLLRLKAHILSPSANMRATVVTSVKFMMDEKKPIDDVLDTTELRSAYETLEKETMNVVGAE